MLAGAVAAVFMYHHVSATPAGGPYGRALTVTPQEFDDQLRLLRARGCVVVAADRLVADVAGGRERPCEVALTFDDGYADAATVAAPILERSGDVGTFFVTSGYVGAAGHLTAAMVRDLAAAGMEIGAHTRTHPDLTRCGPARLRDELVGSRAALRAMSRQPVEAFAYPAGRYDGLAEAAARDAGYAFALTTDAQPVTAASIRRDRFAIGRYRVLRGRGDALFRHVLGSGAPRAPVISDASAHAIARARAEGNAPEVAERVGVALILAGFPEEILKIRTYAVGSSVIVGVMLSGSKFHVPVDRQTFEADVADMIFRTLAADPAVAEVDVWAVVPIPVAPTATVSGDFAVPTNRTVFSVAARRAAWTREEQGVPGAYFEPGFLAQR